VKNGGKSLFTFHFLFFIMLLAIDIGNSYTKFGVFENSTLLHRFAIPTVRHQIADEIYNSTLPRSIHAVIISSVVPELKNTYTEFSKKRFNLEPTFVDNSFDFNLKIKYFPPQSLGVDRIVNAFAAVELYGKPSIVCSFGTATTIDAVNSKGEYLGGTIAPGMNLMSESLFLKTSKLPRVEITKPANVIGNSTDKSIQAGIFFGYIGLIEGIIDRMKIELGGKLKVIATGGSAKLVAENSGKIDIVDENLQLEGLRHVYEKRFR
jgi:type III pantothenate kinase